MNSSSNVMKARADGMYQSKQNEFSRKHFLDFSNFIIYKRIEIL